MRRFSILFLIIISLFLRGNVSHALVKGGIEYSLPIDYAKLSDTELEAKARTYYYKVIYTDSSEVTEDVTNALMLYSVLQKKQPQNVEYSVKLALLYDKINNRKYAKPNYARAISINKNSPVAYFYYGKHYYKYQEYRKALKCLEKAYKYGYASNYETLFLLGDIHQKLGELNISLNYYNEAYKHNPNEELSNIIKTLNDKIGS